MELYIVRPGDTMRGIARRCGLSATELAELNQLGDPARLIPNMALLLPSREKRSRPEILALGCALPSTSEAALRETLPGLSFLCPISARLTAAGELLDVPEARQPRTAAELGVPPLLCVSNLGESGGFSGEIAHSIFTDPLAQEAALAAILDTLRRGPYAGVLLYFEYVYSFDREAYNRFLRRAAELLHGEGYYLCTALAPRESEEQETPLNAAHDYALHASLADWVLLLSFDWGYAYSAPQAISPVGRIRRALDYALTRVPASKLLLGFSNYGYRWRLPWRQGDAATLIGNAAAMNLAVSVNAELKFDRSAAAPFFTYTDAAAQRNVIFFEDLRSVQARLALLREYELAGLGLWTLGPLYRPGLRLLQDRFGVLKLR